MKRYCPIVLDGCSGVDAPTTNTSSEAPDPFLFAGYGWSPYNPFKPPNLGTGPTDRPDCVNIAWSSLSQAHADLIASLNAQFCTPPPAPPNGSNVNFPMPYLNTQHFGGSASTSTPNTPENYQTFTNDEQTASLTCPDGSVFTVTTAAGSVISPPLDPAIGPSWVLYINASIQAFLLQQLYAMQACMEPDIKVPPFDWKPGDPWPDGSTPPPEWTQGDDWPTPHPNQPPTGVGDDYGYTCRASTLVNALNTYEVTSQNPADDFNFALSGTVPPNVNVVKVGPKIAEVQGTPTLPGRYDYTVTATQIGAPFTVTFNTTLFVLGITNDVLPNGVVGTPYSQQLLTAGTAAPVTFTLMGTLPAGLTLSSSGVISGTPTTVTP